MSGQINRDYGPGRNEMKIFIVAIIFILVAGGFLACSTKSNEIMISSETNFKIYEIAADAQSEYRYEIYDKNGDVVKNEITSRYPNICYMHDGTLLSINIGVGTGISLTQFYDINRNIFSELFFSVVSEGQGNIIHMTVLDDTIRLVVRDIFDKSKLYKEFELDFSPVANPVDAIISVDFLDENVFEISYLSGEDYIAKTRVFEIN